MSFLHKIRVAIELLKPSKPRPVYINNVTLEPSALLSGRKALITGGTSGIGFQIAKAFLNAGADVIITGRSQARIDEAVKKLRAEKKTNSNIDGFVLDVSDADIIAEKVKSLFYQAKAPDILVNNAGIGGGGMPHTQPEEFDKVIATNLRGTYFLSQEFAKNLIINHIDNSNILNIASSSSLRPAISPYTVSKWGIRGLTLGLAKALIKHNIVVNGLAPGPTATPMLLGDNRDKTPPPLPNSPIGRYIMPEEIANMAVILVSDLGRAIVGDIIYITGGAGVITYDDIPTSFDI